MAKNIKEDGGKDSHRHRGKNDEGKKHGGDDGNRKKDDDDSSMMNMVGQAEKSISSIGKQAEKAMEGGVKQLAGALMPNIDPSAVMGGMMKFAKMLAPNPTKMGPPPKVPLSNSNGGPKEIVHLPG